MKHYYCWTLPHYINSYAVYKCLAMYPISNDRNYVFKSSTTKSANNTMVTCASAVIITRSDSRDGTARQSTIRTLMRR